MASYGETSYGEVSYGEDLTLDLSFPVEDIEVSDVLVGSMNTAQSLTDGMTASDFQTEGKTLFGSIAEDANTNDTIATLTILNIIETIQVSETLTPTSTFGILAIDSVEMDDTLYVGFPISVVEALGIDDAIVVNKNQFIAALEQVEIAEILSTAAVWQQGTSDDIQIADLADIRLAGVLAEIMNVSSTLIVSKIATVTESEIVEISDTIAESIRYSIELLANLLVSEEPLETTQSTSQEIEEDIVLSSLIEKTEFEGYAMNPENYAVSKYLLGFQESTAFGDKFLFADDTGLYELGGTTDNGTAIISTIKTAALDLGTSNIKQMPSVMLGTNGTKAILKVSIDGSHTTHYEITGRSSALMTKHVKLGKGLLGKYWQFTLISDSDDFDLDTFEFYPITFNRKHNG